MLSIELIVKSNGNVIPLDRLIDMVADRVAESLKAATQQPVPIVPREDTFLHEQSKRAYGLKETAKMLGVSEGSLRRWASMGRIPSVRLGSRVLISRQTIEKILRGGVK
jgi:excisionase family DNA binding protein